LALPSLINPGAGREIATPVFPGIKERKKGSQWFTKGYISKVHTESKDIDFRLLRRYAPRNDEEWVSKGIKLFNPFI
jgi:hypothetical protein